MSAREVESRKRPLSSAAKIKTEVHRDTRGRILLLVITCAAVSKTLQLRCTDMFDLLLVGEILAN